VADRLTHLGFHVQRLGGTDRYATARAIAHQLGDPAKVIVATGHDYADALTAGPLAAKLGAAILLSDGPTLDSGTAAYVRHALATSTTTSPAVYAVGGDGESAVRSVSEGQWWLGLSGTDRYATAAAVAYRSSRRTRAGSTQSA
jgi:putative cell wall-binding protein